MTPSGDYLKTQTVAEALGLSVSTIKRWVDSGTIQAVRTVGKHRLIPRSEAARVAQELRLGGVKDVDVGSPAAEPQAVTEETCDRLFGYLKDGRSSEALRFIREVYLGGCSAVSLADQLIRPVMGRIGHGWMVGALDVYEEHQASQIVATALQELIARVSRERVPSGPLAIGATTEGDPYLLSGLLADLLLRELGWKVRNLGVNLPLSSLANATSEYRPTLVFLSINYLRDRDRFLREYRSFYETASLTNAAVILGGQALDSELRSRLLYTAFGDRMIHLAEFARQLSPTPRTTARGAASSGEAAHPTSRTSSNLD